MCRVDSSAYRSQRVGFDKKWNWWNRNILGTTFIFGGFFKFLVFFCVESLPNPAALSKQSNWSASKAWQVLSTKNLHFNKTTSCSYYYYPLRHEDHHRCIGIPGIPSEMQSRPEQSYHLLGVLLPSDYRYPTEFSMVVPPLTLQTRHLSSLCRTTFSD